jgi:spore coat protein JC
MQERARGGMGVYNYRKRFFYPIHVERADPALAKKLLEHYGGKDGELTQVTQYLNHQANSANRFLRELLGLIAAEELAHLEAMATVINKLGEDLYYKSSKGIAWDIRYVNQNTEPVTMLKADVSLEIRSRVLYEKHMSQTTDVGVQRLLGFLARREGIHQSLLNRSCKALSDVGSTEQFMEIIYDYKMSLQVLE